jgi:DNA polymerase I
VVYDGPHRRAVLKFLDPSTQKVMLVPDESGHKPYCLSNLVPEEVQKLNGITQHAGFSGTGIVRKYDP